MHFHCVQFVPLPSLCALSLWRKWPACPALEQQPIIPSHSLPEVKGSSFPQQPAKNWAEAFFTAPNFFKLFTSDQMFCLKRLSWCGKLCPLVRWFLRLELTFEMTWRLFLERMMSERGVGGHWNFTVLLLNCGYRVNTKTAPDLNWCVTNKSSGRYKNVGTYLCGVLCLWHWLFNVTWLCERPTTALKQTINLDQDEH